MAFNFIIPTITSLAPGIPCIIPVPWAHLCERLRGGAGRMIWHIHVVHEGKAVEEIERIVEVENGAVKGGDPEPFRWDGEVASGAEHPGFLECGFRAADGEPIFVSKGALPFYSIYSAPGRKSYFSDNALKYASPPVIAQIAAYGQYVDAYPAIRIDRDRDAGMSLILINPYLKAVLGRVATVDGRAIERLRIPPKSGRRVALDQLLKEDESSWAGQIQLTANNRLVAFLNWHSLADPSRISDQEHLDPYRGEATHVPATQHLRVLAARALKSMRRGASARNFAAQTDIQPDPQPDSRDRP